ncbi:amidophosphoribosyltransferase [candidate division WOR-1 bacterium RIFOXYA2_FULL_36_21]|uniref:Amidophosphoribosyltransferase n=1 Tax=candidate division WOR-1 bacterium RIFOXYB2_FULL_36_35 TaxID=1802578 RepID=A0A1F4S3B6_UNCSA|nr:MAG: amidophosphoribosyltransferase [candidate division WOR-1 bacterium RIFOXYA2_FULL_36_21]OGC14922.1 MAG: amidophosphoribosyltransferase [candidate division WOR-1 bacterium RIFOXYB2_FULL_36_35]OGC16751.1 MAG: amidophosphoribosyltransferase [candidate division WOR-1 bacterium RIFOXYA12_FULL_36_13]
MTCFNCSSKCDKPEEACGVFGIYSYDGDHLAKTTYYGLFSLQHRGQESAGIAVSNGKEINYQVGMGLVNVVFKEWSLKDLTGNISIGHVRYSTTGGSSLSNAQPFVLDTKFGPVAVAHNGNLINTDELKQGLQDKGFKFSGTSDTEVIAGLIATSEKDKFEEALFSVLDQIQGAFSLLIMTTDKLFAIKDPHGVRPLCVGELDEAYVVASETCALDIVGAKFLREISNGEIVIIDKEGMQSKTYSRKKKSALCVFEFIYFARPDSVINGRSVYEARVSMGKYLAKEHNSPYMDFISGVPDSGIPAAIGFASESRIPFGDSLIKNRYVGRTFIQPSQEIRDMGVKIKLNPLRETVRNSKLVVLDDSIVRGTTSRQIVKILKDAGAREVHFRVSSPPITHSCFYGIDTPSRAELIAANLSVEGIRKYLDVESLGYLSLESLVRSINLPRNSLCLACLSGSYPIEIPEKLETLKLFFK